MKGIRCHHSGKTYTYTPAYQVKYWNGIPVKVQNKVPAGVLITHPCGTRQWISNSWYLDIDL
jgi:hypothetical protein